MKRNAATVVPAAGPAKWILHKWVTGSVFSAGNAGKYVPPVPSVVYQNVERSG